MKIAKNNKTRGIFLATFIIIVSVLFFNVPGASLAAPTDEGTCIYSDSAQSAPQSKEMQRQECVDFCAKNAQTIARYCKFTSSGGTGYADDPNSEDINIPESKVTKWVLGVILRFFGWILNLALLLFAWAVDPKSLTMIIDNDAVRKTWELVRDFCNLGFILILVFSAFATIFQVDKYNYKKILLWLIIMALLVNFSFPISRFIIDASNSLMYSILNIEFAGYVADGGKIFTDTSAFGNLKDIITPPKSNVTQLLASIVFIFILALTILAMSLILIIRTIALAVIVIFSPIGFVGTIIGKDGGWWNHLFKNAMAGPIMALVLLVSIRLMEAADDAGGVTLSGAGYGQQLVDLPIITSMANFAIPIIILWIGMGMAVKGIEGAGTILGKAQGFAKWTGKLPWRGAKVGLKKFDRDVVGIRGAIKAWKDRTAELETDKVGYQTARARDWLGSVFDRGKRDSSFYRDVNEANMVAKYKKEQDLFSTTDVDVVAGIEKLKGKKDKESGQRLQAFYHTLAGNKDLNEHEKIMFGYFDPVDAKEHIYETLESSLGAKNAVDALHDISDLNQVNGVYSMCGMTYDITKDNTYDESGNVLEGKEEDAKRLKQGITRRKSTTQEQIDNAFAKMKQIDYQKMMIGLHADTIVTEDKDGNGSGVHDFGLKALEFIEGKDAKFVTDRWRGDTGVKIRQGLMANPEVAARFPLILAALTGGEDALKLKKAELAETAKKKTGSTSGPATEAKPKEEPKKTEPAKEEEPLIKVVGKYSPLK